MDSKIEQLFSLEGLEKIKKLDNKKLENFLEEQIKHLNPKSVFVGDDSNDTLDYIRSKAKELGEENPLTTQGHTSHFDGYFDQARDKEHSKILSSKPIQKINTSDRKEGLDEVKGVLKNIMDGRELIVMFFTLGPAHSDFSIPCVQLTDSYYVAHSESILYRLGYENFKNAGEDFFKFIHSSGKLSEDMISVEVENRRVYIDIEDNTSYSANTQYGGNVLGLKKLAMRFAIRKASAEGWLCEHMFLMGIKGQEGEKTYFAGAFPSACGKTSTSMMPGESIVGDDIAYLKIIDGHPRAVNVEKGIFGIIKDVNAKDDPIIYKALTSPREIIFSNILVNDNKPYWLGMGSEIPADGKNYSGAWTEGKTDDNGKEVTPSHKNARYTLAIHELDNMDENIDSVEGCPLGGMIYGGRDSDTTVPVEESFDYSHGILTKGATIESETTAATLGAEGVRKFNLMSNLDFLSIPLGRYIQDNLDFGSKTENPPKIFSVNYFLKDHDGSYLNDMDDKHVWLKWMQKRATGKVDALTTPTGYIPKFEDLKNLFKDVLDKEYTEADYIQQFTIRIPELLAKIERIREVYKEIEDTPKELFKALDEQQERLQIAKDGHGDYISPLDL